MRDTEFTFKSLITKLMLACSDLICFNAALFLAMMLINLQSDSPLADISEKEMNLKIATHICLSVICIGWFWVRLRHYTYRKPFWFELKEVFRTILIFSVIDLSITALSQWQMSRFVWLLTWILALILIPTCRALSKRLLNKNGLWKNRPLLSAAAKMRTKPGRHCKAKRSWVLTLSPSMTLMEPVRRRS